MGFVVNETNAMTLGLTWGARRPRSGSEVMAFRKGLRAAEVSDRDECVIAGWLGGAQPAEVLHWWEVERTSLEDHCLREGFKDVNLAASLARLYGVAPTLANLIYVKATAKAESEAASSLVNEKQSRNKSKAELLGLLNKANDAVKLALEHPAEFVKTVIKQGAETVESVFSIIPGGGWTVGIALGIAALGVAAYVIRAIK